MWLESTRHSEPIKPGTSKTSTVSIIERPCGVVTISAISAIAVTRASRDPRGHIRVDRVAAHLHGSQLSPRPPFRLLVSPRTALHPKRRGGLRGPFDRVGNAKCTRHTARRFSDLLPHLALELFAAGGRRADCHGSAHVTGDIDGGGDTANPGLTIPKLGTGSFFPSLLERRRRVDQA